LLPALILVAVLLAVGPVHQHTEAPGVVGKVPGIAERDLGAGVRIERRGADADPCIEAIDQALVNGARVGKRGSGVAGTQRAEDVSDADVAAIVTVAWRSACGSGVAPPGYFSPL